MIPTIAPEVYTDIQGLARLRLSAKEKSPEALRAVAEQFEAIFTQMMLKSMRDASLGEGAFDSEQSKHYQDMFDKQLSVSLSKKGGMGIADMLVRQLGGEKSEAIPMKTLAMVNRAEPATGIKRAKPVSSPEEFVELLGAAAHQTADKLGVPGETLLAQAALETGWGKSIIKHPDGHSSHNLFGIKADTSWQGDRVTSTTLEYVDGIAVRKNESFRSYGSYEESFEDYADFLKSSPRYSQALDMAHDARAYTQALQDAGYATDPAYANKINAIQQGEILTQAFSMLEKKQGFEDKQEEKSLI